MQSEIGALKDIRKNVNRNAANDLIRHDQNDWQTTSAGKKIVKTVQSEESNYNEKNKI